MKRTRSEVVFDVLNYIFLSLFALLCIYPFYYIVMYSLSDPLAAAKGEALLWPAGFNLENYKLLLKDSEIYTAFFVSVARTVLGTAITVLCSSFVAYMLTNKLLPFKRFFYRMIVATMYFNAGLIPYYLLIGELGLKDSFLVYIIPGAISAYYVILIRTYINEMPYELQESAMLDGAGIVTIYRKIIFPLSTPILATVSVFAAVGQWNSWFDNMLYITNHKLDTLQYILYRYLAGAQAIAMVARESANISDVGQSMASAATPMSIQMTTTVIVVIPIFFVYPFFQKFFTKGIMLGAVKG